MKIHESKTFVLTGVSSGVGAATVDLLKSEGARIIGLDLKEPTSTVDRFVQCDLTHPDLIDEAVSRIDETVHGLVNIAGVPGSLPVDVVAKVNFLALRKLTEALLPRIADFGAVVNIASTAGQQWRTRVPTCKKVILAEGWDAGLAAFLDVGLNSVAAYDFSKELVILYSQLVASRERHRGVRVNTVSPGAVQTPILKTFYETMGADLLDNLRNQAGGRDAKPSEIAGPVSLLLSPESLWVNGADLIADGGAEVLMNLEADAVPAKPLQF
ncbi:coniferyl-alcohol dehydrogenase [Rhizobium leguminosarum]